MRDHVTGTLRAGLAADLVMLGGDIKVTEPVLIPICGGRIIHAADAL